MSELAAGSNRPIMPPPPPPLPPPLPLPLPLQPQYPPILRPLKRQFPFPPRTLMTPAAASAGAAVPSEAGFVPDGMKEPLALPPKGNYEVIHQNITGWRQGYTNVPNNHSVKTVTGTGGKRYSKGKGSKLAISGSHDPSTNAEVPSTAPLSGSNCRHDSSLGLLTKKFLELIQKADDSSLDLKEAAKILKVQKRRIYDITNVLEGIGLIEKSLKNRITWKGLDILRPTRLDVQVSQMKAEIESMHAEDRGLDERIRNMQDRLSSLTADENCKKWLYVSKEDINNLPCLQNDTLIAIKAPHGTTLEVLDPDNVADYPQEQYQMLLRSATGPIDCYLISKFDEGSEDINQVLQAKGAELSTESNSITKNRELPPETCRLRDAEGQALQNTTRCPLSTPSSAGAIMKIVPPDADVDADYWLLSDHEGRSITKMWNTE